MQKDLLRLISQKRFKLMNRWNADAAKHQGDFGAVEDHVFRSFIYRAFEHLMDEIRRKGEGNGDPGTGESLLDRFEFPALPDIAGYRRVLNIGIQVIDSFLRDDPVCRTRFAGPIRSGARQTLKEAAGSFLENEERAYRRLARPETDGNLYCIKCGRPFP